MDEKWIRNYLEGFTKEAVIELYLQMRFERDLFMQIADDDNRKWIPCSERMPEEFTMVLVDINGYVCTGYYGFKCKHGWFMEDSTPFVTEPKAWMPLPEPYKED